MGCSSHKSQAVSLRRFFSKKRWGGQLPATLLFLGALLLAACEGTVPEPESRAAFKHLLQTNILSKKGIRFLPLNEEQKKTLGPYAESYTLLGALGEDPELLYSFSGLPALQRKLMQSSDPEVKKKLILEARQSMTAIREKLIAAFKKIMARKEGLNLPQDAQSIYDEAFLKVVRAPTDLLVNLIEQSLDAVAAAEALNSYILQHPDAAVYQGSTVIVEKKEAEADIERFIKAYKVKSEQALMTVRELNNLSW